MDSRLNNIKSRCLENECDSYTWFFAQGLENNGTLSRGVAVGIRKNSLISPGESFIVSEGNAIKVNFKFEGHEFVFFGIYGPSDADNPIFFESIFNECSACTERYKILGGDFNVPLNFNRDTFNCVTDSRKRARERILNKMEDIGLRDVFRSKKSNKETNNEYTIKNCYQRMFRKVFSDLLPTKIFHNLCSI